MTIPPLLCPARGCHAPQATMVGTYRCAAGHVETTTHRQSREERCSLRAARAAYAVEKRDRQRAYLDELVEWICEGCGEKRVLSRRSAGRRVYHDAACRRRAVRA